MKFDSRKDRQRLADFIARFLNEQSQFGRRGMWLNIVRLEVQGRPPEHIRVWGSLHYLTTGSPFLCCDAQDLFFPEYTEEVADAVQRHLKLRSPIAVSFVDVTAVVSENIHEDLIPQRTSVPADINERDNLGRTAIFRAALRDFAAQVEELLAAGADVRIPDREGRTLGALAAEGKLHIYVAYLIQRRLAESEPL